jgi:hypothetical protein
VAAAVSSASFPCRCHVCGVEYERAGELWHLGDGASFYPDGRAPLSCGKHTSEEIREAWLRGQAVSR